MRVKNDACTCNISGVVEKIILLNPKDFIVKDGVLIRAKRKYGKFKRTMYVIDNEQNKNESK